jgi:hypothetical protein
MKPEQRGRTIVRGAALAALVVGAIAIGAVVAGSLDGDDARGKRDRPEEERPVGCRPEAENAVADGFYIVQQDDILSLIAERTCVPDDELARLNPEIDPQALSPGECVSLVERGCEKRE